MENYQSGFGNYFESEVQPGTLPKGQNSPQTLPNDLFAEQISGSSFTTPIRKNLRTWMYKKKPSARQSESVKYKNLNYTTDLHSFEYCPDRLRWSPIDFSKKEKYFHEALHLIAHNGSPESKEGCAIFIYTATNSMKNTAYVSCDGEMLIVPQEGAIKAITELGILIVNPEEILVIPRGFKFKIELIDQKARGYICENYGEPFEIPNKGLMGANSLANDRDFEYPCAEVEKDIDTKYNLISKVGGQLWESKLESSPFDVYGWHGNYSPYKYDLKKFNVINSVSFDHPDPSIFTVLTSPSSITGTANVDFVIFPPRWIVAENTFRPPYFHRNTMSEFMGLIKGEYDAKESSGFKPGGYSIHNCMSGHGPDKASFDKASKEDLKPTYLKDTLAFMFETRLFLMPTHNALSAKNFHKKYSECWLDL